MVLVPRSRTPSWVLLVLLVVAGGLGSASCDRLYYKTMKRFGMEKRDILIDRVRDARKAQTEAKAEFQTALERFKSVIEVESSTLEKKYETLSRELERSEDKARRVRDRIKAVRDVSDDLFKEWQKELGKYADRSLRAESERDLRETKRRADGLIASMARAEARIAPVLKPLQDRVLFLKHNLNARAIGALGNELGTMRGNVDWLIGDLEAAIKDADTFIKEMDADKAATPRAAVTPGSTHGHTSRSTLCRASTSHRAFPSMLQRAPPRRSSQCHSIASRSAAADRTRNTSLA